MHATEARIKVVNYDKHIHMPDEQDLLWTIEDETCRSWEEFNPCQIKWKVRADSVTTCIHKPPFNKPWCATTIDF